MTEYVLLSCREYAPLAKELVGRYPDRFQYCDIDWDKFPDGTDKITIHGFHPVNVIAGRKCIFVSSFHNNDVTLSQFSVFIVLLQSFIKSLTILLPYYPVGKFKLEFCIIVMGNTMYLIDHRYYGACGDGGSGGHC